MENVSMKTPHVYIVSIFYFELQFILFAFFSGENTITKMNSVNNKFGKSLPENLSSRKLVLNQMEWNRIKQNLKPKPVVEQKPSQYSAYEHYLKSESRKMIEKWEDTIEKRRQRKIMEQKMKTEEEKSKGLILMLF